MGMKWQFKEDHTFEHRKKESQKIVEKAEKSNIDDIDKRKYLVPADISVAQFMWIVRKRINLTPEKAILLFVNKIVPSSTATLGEIYSNHKDDDGFLYVAYSGENTFGFHFLYIRVKNYIFFSNLDFSF